MFHIKIGLYVARRCRMLARKKIDGDYVEHFKLCDNYCRELRKTHDDSRVFVDHIAPEHPMELGVFRRLFVCLRPLIDGFLRGCRRLIALDGCHTKGLIKQQILTAVSLGNNNK